MFWNCTNYNPKTTINCCSIFNTYGQSYEPFIPINEVCHPQQYMGHMKSFWEMFVFS